MSLLEADINFGFDSVESLLDSLLKSANASEFVLQLCKAPLPVNPCRGVLSFS